MPEPDTKEIEKHSQVIVTTANEFVIATAEDYRIAAKALKTIKHWRNMVAETFDDLIHTQHLAHKKSVAAKKKHDGPLAAADRTYRNKMSYWKSEQERLEREQAAAARKEALRQAEEERLAEAAKAEAAGQPEHAEALLEAPVVPAPVVIAKTTPTVEGISTRKIYEFDIVDESKLPRLYLMPNMPTIRKQVNALGVDANIPGVEVREKQSIAVRSA
jgi:hypothetical protein